MTKRILLVEDDDLDFECFLRAARAQGFDSGQVLHAREGTQALDLLRETISDESSEQLVVVLDLNMPGMNGIEFLTEIRNDPRFSRLVVFVLTSSDHGRDITNAYELGVSGFSSKENVSEFVKMLRQFLTVSILPPLAGVA